MVKMRKFYKVKITNRETNRTDVHFDLSRWDVEWLRSMCTLKVDILEIDRREINNDAKDR
tara:strand:+ start:1369 stop:1548 length:180 start_codon:yes stop_codon:yes gene_type:complete